MFFLFRRFIKQILLTAAIGFVIRKLMSSQDPRAQRIGQGANRLIGGVIGLDEQARPLPRRRGRKAARSTASAAAGGAMSYFFDPIHGRERREKVKRYASDRLHRNGERPMLPSPERSAPITTPPAPTFVPGTPS